jgi:hypothetical protein
MACSFLRARRSPFWRQVGKATARKGYRPGRMLQEGCMIPAIGGGLCQLSNALYQIALDSGCEIVERHRHSRTVPGSATAAGRDATVSWNYVDLRFRPAVDMQLAVELTADHLIVAALKRSYPQPAACPRIATEPSHRQRPRLRYLRRDGVLPQALPASKLAVPDHPPGNRGHRPCVILSGKVRKL